MDLANGWYNQEKDTVIVEVEIDFLTFGGAQIHFDPHFQSVWELVPLQRQRRNTISKTKRKVTKKLVFFRSSRCQMLQWRHSKSCWNTFTRLTPVFWIGSTCSMSFMPVKNGNKITLGFDRAKSYNLWHGRTRPDDKNQGRPQNDKNDIILCQKWPLLFE